MDKIINKIRHRLTLALHPFRAAAPRAAVMHSDKQIKAALETAYKAGLEVGITLGMEA